MADDPISQMFGGPGTVFRGNPNAPAPTFNVAESMGVSGPGAMLVNMGIQSFIPQLFGNKGDIFPQFSPQIGFAEQLRRQSSFTMQQEAMKNASAMDESTYQKILEGMAKASGTTFGDREKKAAATMAKDLASFMPILSQVAPEMVDRMHGFKGSAVVMAQQMAQGARYAQDPLTGGIGMSGKSLDQLTKTFYDKLYGDKADVSQMRGVTAGAAGAMFDQMTRRGLLGTSQVNLDEVAKAEGKTLEEFSKLPDFSAKVQQFQASRAADRIKAMSGAVSAMKDIFGENGQADAPMSQIFNALQAVTQNNLGNMNPAEVERTVRNMHNAAKISGVDLQGMLAMNATAGQITDRLGLDRSFATSIATGALTSAAAYGGTVGNMRSFGLFDKEKAMQVNANIIGAANASQEANEAAALLRLEEAGAISKNAQNAELMDYIDSLKKGERVKPMGATKLRDLVQKSGVDIGTFTAFAAQREENQQTIANRSLGKVVGEQAFVEQAKALTGAGLSSGMQLSGIKADEKQTDQFIRSVVEDISNFSEKEMEEFNRGNFKPYLQKAKANFKNATGRDLSDTQAATFLSFGSGQVTRMAKQMGYGTGANIFTQFNQQYLRAKDIAEKQANLTTSMDIALSEFGKGTPMQRVVETLIQSKPGDTFGDMIKGVFGVIDQNKLDDALKAGIGMDVAKFKQLDSRDLIKDIADLTVVAGKNNLQNMSKEQTAQIEDIKKVYGFTDDEIKGMAGNTEENIRQKINSKGNTVKLDVLRKIKSTLDATGISKLDMVQPAAPGAATPALPGAQGAAPAAPVVGAGGQVIQPAVNQNLLDIKQAALDDVTRKREDMAKELREGKIKGFFGGKYTNFEDYEPYKALKKEEDSKRAALEADKKAMQSAAQPVQPTATTASAGQLIKQFDLGKAAMSAFTQVIPFLSGGKMATALNDSDKQKQKTVAQKEKENEEKSRSKIQMVRLEGGTELTGRLNIVSEEVLLKIPQTQKV